MDEILYSLLQECVVRIAPYDDFEVTHGGHGTGFFVAPSVILRGCLKSPDSVIFHRLCFPFQLPNSWGEPWSAYRES